MRQLIANTTISSFLQVAFTALSLSAVGISFAQPAAINRKKKPYKFMFTLGYVVVNDNEEKLPNLLSVSDSWNCAPYPSYFAFNKYAKKGFSNEGVFTFTPYRSQAIVNDRTNLNGFVASANYAYRFDPNLRFKKMSPTFAPFIATGVGITYRHTDIDQITATLNLHLGMTYWFAKQWGLQLQGIGKLAAVPDLYVSRLDYLQYSLGVSYRNSPRKKSPKNKRRYKWTEERIRYRRDGS